MDASFTGQPFAKLQTLRWLLLCRRRLLWSRDSLRLRRLRWFLRSLHLRRSQDQVQRVAFLTRTKLHHSLVAQILNEPLKNFAAQTLARHLASTEEDGRLDLVSLGKEAQHMVLLGVIVVIVHIDAELHFLDHDLVLVLFG